MSVLIIECTNEDCEHLTEDSKFWNDSGNREWAAQYDDDKDKWNGGKEVLLCPECGQIGRVWWY